MKTSIVCLLLAINIYMISGQTVNPPSLADFSQTCSLFNTSFTCARAIGAICLWDSGSNMCTFRSKSCPNDIKQAMLAVSGCGATLNTSCPAQCQQPQLSFVAILHVHAGLHTYTPQDQLLSKAMTNATIAQAIADVQYCTTELTPAQYTNMLFEACQPTAEQYNVAITAAYSTSSNAPGSSSSSSSGSSGGSSGTSSTASSSATPAVLAINTLINGLALGLIIMFAAGM